MKVAIPLDEDRTSICPSMGRAPYFVFFHEGDREEILPNPGAQAQSGAGLQAAQFLIDQGANALITPRCGQNAADVFRAARIDIYQSQGTGAWDNAQAFLEGRLEQMTHFHAGYHGIR